jgi:hypothetical protein
MKLADRTVEVHSAGVSASNQFSIAQTSKMFKILSDSLYSDKVMAVIRELATNAYDSHIAAGNKNPFLVKLPTAADPNFTVRDYGTGLSQADMESLYTTYGASNKNTSNDFVGCLGLGSKSPFAYTKSFTTTSYFNGTQYTYIAAIDDSGVPTLNLIHSCETSEPNGLEISFAVKQYDFTEFSQKAIRIFHYFKMKPIINGGVHWDFSKDYDNKNIVISGEGWRVCRLNNDSKLFPNQSHRINSGVIAIMGNIAYPIETENLIGEEKVETPDHIARWNRAFNKADIASWKSFVSEVINHGLYLELDFGIGELEMDVSREGLQYTKAVIKNLRSKTQEIFAELKDMFSDKIAAAKTKVEAISTYYQLNDLAGGWGVGASWKDDNGKVHDISSGSDLEYKLKKSKNLYVFNYRTAGYRSRRMIYLTNMIHHETLTGKGYNYWNNARKTGQITFFYCDMAATETAKKILTKYCNQNDCFAYLMVDTDDHKNVGSGFEDLISDVGEDNILNVSDYRDLLKSNSPRKTSTKGSKGSVSDQDVFLIVGDQKNTSPLTIEYNSSSYMRSMTSDRLDEFLEEDTIVYVPILRYASTSGYPSVTEIYSQLGTDNNIARIPDFLDGTNIYAIKHNFVNKLIAEGYNLVDFNTWMKSRLKSYNTDKFAEMIKFNAMVEKCKKEYDSHDKTTSDYYGRAYIDRTVLYHILNIFGLDYEKYISNKEIVKCLNNLMVIEFFAYTIHCDKFDMNRFSQTDYYGLITKLLRDIGINGLNSKEIKNMNITYNSILSMLRCLYAATDSSGATHDNYISIIKTDVGNNYPMPSMDSIRNTLKVEIDKNPLLKYIISSNSVDGNLRGLNKNPNPLKQIDGASSRYNYYSNSSGRESWFQKMDDVESFKQQLSSTIK